MEEIISPNEFFEFLNSGLIEMNSDVFILFNPFDIQSLGLVENIIAQLRDVFF